MVSCSPLYMPSIHFCLVYLYNLHFPYLLYFLVLYTFPPLSYTFGGFQTFRGDVWRALHGGKMSNFLQDTVARGWQINALNKVGYESEHWHLCSWCYELLSVQVQSTKICSCRVFGPVVMHTDWNLALLSFNHLSTKEFLQPWETVWAIDEWFNQHALFSMKDGGSTCRILKY